MTQNQRLPISFLQRLAKGLARQFGGDCEVVVHDLTAAQPEQTIVVIENGHVTNRRVGDGPSHIVLEALRRDPAELEDQLGYLSATHDGRILKSSTIYLRDGQESIVGILSLNYDITHLVMAGKAINALAGASDAAGQKKPERIPQNVNDLLDELIDQSVSQIGKPVALMAKEDKIRAIQFLNKAGAFLITKAGDKIARHFNISKYTLYSYIDAAAGDER
jgi:predicted transcriptional regulator YheO